MTTTKVFVSSVMRGMEPDRTAVERVLTELSVQPIRFEIFPARPSSARDVCLEEVQDSEIFIHLVSERITEIVVEEYEKALETNPESILVFAKDCDRSIQAEMHLRRIAKSHTYRKYSDLQDLCDQVKLAVQALVTDALRKGRPPKMKEKSEILFDGKVRLDTWKTWKLEFDIKKNERIKGIVEARDTFDVYVFNERRYANWRSGSTFNPEAHEVRAHAIDRIARYDDTWYVVVKVLAWSAPMDIRIRLRKISEA